MSVFTKKSNGKSAVWAVFDLKIENELCDLGVMQIRSQALAKHLDGCHRVILFAATLGATFDRELQKQTRLSPARAYELQMQGLREIERFCDTLCKDLEVELESTLRVRFSPGYQDLSLEVQRDIFRVLEPNKHIGLCLGDSCVMSPSKSVTAFVGVEQ